MDANRVRNPVLCARAERKREAEVHCHVHHACDGLAAPVAPDLDFRNNPFAVRGAPMSGAPLRLLLVIILLLSGLHNAAPAAAGMTHHATDSHLAHHAESGHASGKDSSNGQQDADIHGSHHNCPVASDQALAGHDDLSCFSGGLLFVLPATRLASRALAPPLNPPLA